MVRILQLIQRGTTVFTAQITCSLEVRKREFSFPRPEVEIAAINIGRRIAVIKDKSSIEVTERLVLPTDERIADRAVDVALSMVRIY